MPKRFLLLSTLALTACAAFPQGEDPAPPAVATARPTDYSHFPAPTGSVTVGPDSSLSDLLAAWEGVTGLTFSADPPTQASLEVTHLGIGHEVTVPPESVYAWAGALLLQNGFVMANLTGSEPQLVGVYSLHGQSAPLSTDIPVDELGEYLHHPALMIQTAIHLEHVDVRTLGNSLRGIGSDASGRQGIIPVGNTSTVLLQGTVRQVTGLVEMLRRLNEEEGEKRAAAEG